MHFTPAPSKWLTCVVDIIFSTFSSKLYAVIVCSSLPLSIGEIPGFEEHCDSLFKVVHVGPIATGIQALMLLFQVLAAY